MSNNLNLDQVASNQTQKETTINAATAELDAAITEVLSVSFAGGVDVTLTSAQFRSAVIFTPTGQTGNGLNLIIPGVKRGLFAVQNLSSSYNIIVKRGSGTVTIAASSTALLKTDGTTNDMVKIAEAQNASGTIPYDIGFFVPGKPSSAALSAKMIMTRSVTIPISATGSQASATTASTGNVSFDIQKNGVSKGSVVFNASGTGTFTFSNAVTWAAGDLLQLIAPGSQDATLADISITFMATR